MMNNTTSNVEEDIRDGNYNEWTCLSYCSSTFVQLVDDFGMYAVSREVDVVSWTLHVPSEVFNPRSPGTNYLE